MSVNNTTNITFCFDSQDYASYTTREQLRRAHIFGRYNPICFYARHLNYFKQAENTEDYTFNDIYNILTMFSSTYQANIYIGLPDERFCTKEKIEYCYNFLTQCTCLCLSICLDYSFDNIVNDNFLDVPSGLFKLENIKNYNTKDYIEQIKKYISFVINKIKKDKNYSSEKNLFILNLGLKSITQFTYPSIPYSCIINFVKKINNTIYSSFENYNKLNLLKSENIYISDDLIRKQIKLFKEKEKAEKTKYNKLLKQFNKIKTEYDCISFIMENAEKSAFIYAKGHVNPINMPERTTTVRIQYFPENDENSWICTSNDYRGNNNYNGEDYDMARRYLAGAWYQTFTTETKLDIAIDNLNFSKEFKQN